MLRTLCSVVVLGLAFTNVAEAKGSKSVRSGHASVHANKSVNKHVVKRAGYNGHQGYKAVNKRVGYKGYRGGYRGYGYKFEHGYYYTGRYHPTWTRWYYSKLYKAPIYWDNTTRVYYYWYAPKACYYPVSYASYAAPTVCETPIDLDSGCTQIEAPE
jgi:hypothetical protein